jgi:peptide/nickel transport system ATP-binding protein
MLRGALVSMIFQDPMTSLNPVLTVGDQIHEVLLLHHKDMPQRQMDEKVDSILSLVGISPSRKSEYPHQFSGGMKQRVVIAIALTCEPLLLLADEPTTALDVTIQAQVLQMMDRLKKQFNTAMLLITHDLGIVARICDRVAIIYSGQIVESGTIYDIFEGEDHHPYTVGLFNSIPDLTRKTRRLSPIDGLMPDPTKLIPGCKFSDRCPRRIHICEVSEPSKFLSGGHIIKCHLYGSQDTETSVLLDEKWR